MEQQNINRHEEKVFDMLDHWKGLDVPEYFETRIMSRIDAVRPVKSVKWGWAMVAIVLLTNSIAAVNYFKQSKFDNEQIYQQYLQSNPDLENFYSIQS